MKFIKAFLVSSLVASLAYYCAVLLMIDTPVSAEYWVAEMITVKKALVKEYAGTRKIIVAGGSSTLFSVDTEYASKQLDMPVINFGLHAGLRLNKIFKEVGAVIEGGDILIFQLEPQYYDCHPKLNLWQINNIVGWDHDAWNEMSYVEKMEFVSMVSPRLFVQMIIANIQRIYNEPLIYSRMAALDHSSTLRRFRARTTPAKMRYSIYNLNDHGDLMQTEGTITKVKSEDLGKPDHVCDTTASQLAGFVENMRAKGVQVYFANTPFVSAADLGEFRKGESSFLNDFNRVGCMIDKREDLVFDPKYFFDFKLHLNAQGRAIRTDLLIQSIRKNVLSGTCGH